MRLSKKSWKVRKEAAEKKENLFAIFSMYDFPELQDKAPVVK